MHDLLQEMAFEIVRQESIKELGKRSRLWSPRDVSQVLTKNLSVIRVDVSGCSNVTKFPNIPENTRYLYLSETAVEEFPSSVGHLWRISSLDLSNCGRLKNLPSTIHELACLEKLNLSGCSTITEFPNVSCNIKELYLDGTAIEEIPSSIECCYKLVELRLRNCTKFESLPGTICNLKSLEKLNLSGCSQLKRFPGVLETMESLRYLYLDRTGIKNLPSPIRNLKGLCFLELGNCIYLEGKDLSDLRLLEQDVDLKYLRKLNLSGCGIREVPKSLGCLTSLEALDLSGNNFVILPKDISKLYELQYLGLRYCSRLVSLQKLPPRLAKLDAHSCTSLTTVPSSSTIVDGNIFEFIFTNCLKLGEIAHNNIMAYALLKIQLYAKRLYNEVSLSLSLSLSLTHTHTHTHTRVQSCLIISLYCYCHLLCFHGCMVEHFFTLQISSVAAGVSSFCLPGSKVPAWFLQQNSAASVTIQLLSGCANSELLGFVLCTVVAFEPSYDASGGFQVKCTYHFKNDHADPCILHCYFASCYGSLHKRSVQSDHVFFGYDPCLNATKDFWYGKYSEVSVEFSVEDMDNNPLQRCHVSKCGVRELYTQAESYCDFILPYRQEGGAKEEDKSSAFILPESKLVDQIVHHILKELNKSFSSDLKGLVGIDSLIKEIVASLSAESPECFVVGIWGMGGIGKTTIAGEIFNKIAGEYEADIGISVLVDMCLLTISGNKIGMHDLLQHMAHFIVRQESVHIGKRSRLWDFNDVYEVLTRNLGTKNVEGIFVDLDSFEKKMKITSTAFARMYNLRVLIVRKSGFGNNENVQYLNLNETSLPELPRSIEHLGRLVALNLSDCKQLGNLPEDFRSLKSLEIADLSGCSNIAMFPAFPESVRYIYLSGTAIEEIPSSIDRLSRLFCLNLMDCKRLKNLPCTFSKLASLQKLSLSGCSIITEFPDLPVSIKELYLDGTAISEIPSNLECNLLPEVQSLLKFNEREVKLCRLHQLYLNDCKLLFLPGSLAFLSSLEVLDLSGNSFTLLPTLTKLLKLKSLILRNCVELECIPTLPPRLMKLDANNCSSLSSMPPVISGTSSVCFPGINVPDWFRNQTQGFSLTIKLPSQSATDQFLGFVLCAVVDFGYSFKTSDGSQVKCIYHIKNEDEDSHDLLSYFGGWFDGEHVREVSNDMLFVGYDPCLEFTKCYVFGKCSEVVIEFYPEDRSTNPLKSCNVIKCGVRLLSAQDDNSVKIGKNSTHNHHRTGDTNPQPPQKITDLHHKKEHRIGRRRPQPKIPNKLYKETDQ
ncbi:hypothetical protein SADUNF_Sadunf19G0075900 [Salix dunnii]|uniref:ADP-ribosyl cyclase/cyclic ADP-ribose hydrolase n=1 Tax=Salix dunnii TaxID=1413687 RepID=A0A835MCS6_9ROSI|nr:hypothetical protein SADUNF_Sadunf19G0075900 [Salix dunnii]